MKPSELETGTRFGSDIQGQGGDGKLGTEKDDLPARGLNGAAICLCLYDYCFQLFFLMEKRMSSNDSKDGFLVPAGKDRFNENERKIWGLIPLATKVSSEDTGGAFFIFEHRNLGKGGPPRHIHHHQDEWFYVVQGEFAVEVGEKKLRMKPGDSYFAPRIAHAWAHVGDGPGTMLTIASPAGTFARFLRDTTKHATLPKEAEIASAFAEHDMTVVGPPLAVD